MVFLQAHRLTVRHEHCTRVRYLVFTVAILAQGTNRGDALCAALLSNRVVSILLHVGFHPTMIFNNDFQVLTRYGSSRGGVTISNHRLSRRVMSRFLIKGVCVRTRNFSHVKFFFAFFLFFSRSFTSTFCKKPTAPEGFPARSPTTVLAGPSQA